MPRVPGEGVALMERSVGRVPKAFLTKLDFFHVSCSHWLFILGINNDKSTTNTTFLGNMPPIPTSFNISHLFTTPMDKNNYLSWRSQFMDVLELHDLEDVIAYDTRPPKKHADGTPNPAYSKDKLVLSWIKATASSTIKTLLIPCTTGHEAWDLRGKDDTRRVACSPWTSLSPNFSNPFE
ncbi:hypothetical protein CerSpe_237480 [Prunus speciosa]